MPRRAAPHRGDVRGQVSNSAIDKIPGVPPSLSSSPPLPPAPQRGMKCKSLLDYGSANPLEILRDTARLGARKYSCGLGGVRGQTPSIFIAALRSPRKLIPGVTGRIQKAKGVLSHAFNGMLFLGAVQLYNHRESHDDDDDDASGDAVAVFFNAKHARRKKWIIPREAFRIYITPAIYRSIDVIVASTKRRKIFR